MKLIDLEQGTEEWLNYRRGKISGTMLSELYSKRGTRKIGFYKLIAERLSLDPDGENPMDRGLRLEQEAIDLFEVTYEKKVKRYGIWQHEKYPNIILSPDGGIPKGKKITEAVEVKCLSPAKHLQASIENKVPPEYEAQMLQYFIVNEDLKLLYFVFYDPRVTPKPLHVIKITREELKDFPQKYLAFQLEQLKEVNELVERLVKF